MSGLAGCWLFTWWRYAGDCPNVSDRFKNESTCVNVRDQVVPVLGLLQAAERHLRAWNVLLGVLEVLELQHNVSPPFNLDSMCSAAFRNADIGRD